MGRFFGKRWKIDGVTAGPISRHYPANGRYSVIFERDDAFLEQIEKINWPSPRSSVSARTPMNRDCRRVTALRSLISSTTTAAVTTRWSCRRPASISAM